MEGSHESSRQFSAYRPCCWRSSHRARSIFRSLPPQSTRKVFNAPEKTVQAPFSDAILAGNTLYLSGRIGLDPKTGKAPAQVEDEIKLILDGMKGTLEQAGMTMDDLVYVQIACTDLSLFDKFNAIYKSLLHDQGLSRAGIYRSGGAPSRRPLRVAGHRGSPLRRGKPSPR